MKDEPATYKQNVNHLYGEQPSQDMVGMPMGPKMPSPPFRRKSKTWRERIMSRYGMGMHDTLQRGELISPQWLVWKPIVFFFIAFAACTFAFGYAMPFGFALVATAWTLLFFLGANIATRQWQRVSERTFLKNIFWIGFAARIAWGLYSFFYFNPEWFILDDLLFF